MSMETSTTNKSLNYSANQTTISGNSTINTNIDTSRSQTLNKPNNKETQTETLDLSSETESKGLLGTIGDGIKSIGKGISDCGAAVANGAKAAFDWAADGISKAGATLAETAKSVADDAKEFAASAKDWVVDAAETVASTGAVIGTSVVSGVAKLGENLADGVEWVGGKVVEGATWLTGQVAGVFSEDAKESIDNWRINFSKEVKEDIARDKVGEINKAFYEGTEVGKWVNAHSALKYDSEVAKKIQGATEVVAEVAAATALTICTGGAAAPFVVGALAGAGKAAESTYQEHGTDTTFLQELGIAGSGALTGLTWVANGKLGQGALEIGKDIIAKGGATVLKDMGAQMLNKEFVFSKLKEGLSITNAGKININALMNYGLSAMGTAESLTPYITGEEEFNATAALKLGGTYLKYLGLNILEDTARGYVSGYEATGAASKILTEAEKAKLASIPDPVSASSGSLPPDGIDLKPLDSMDDFSTLPLVSKGKIDKTSGVKIPDTSKTPMLYEAGKNSQIATAKDIQNRMDKIGITSESERRAYQTQLNTLSMKLGITPQETQEILDQKLAELVETSEFGRRTGVSTLEKCLDSGDIKNQFQTDVSSGIKNQVLRADLEADAMHVPYDSAYADRPIYGMLFPSDPKKQTTYIMHGPGLGYGQGWSRCVIMFDKDAVIDSTSLCVGDSLDYSPIYNCGWASPTKASDPKFTGGFHSFADKIKSVEDLKEATLEDLTGSFDDYIEIQIHGAKNHQLTPDIIKEVVFEKRPSPSIIKKLEDAGISWRTMGIRRFIPW